MSVCVFVHILQRVIPPALPGISLGWAKSVLDAGWRKGTMVVRGLFLNAHCPLLRFQPRITSLFFIVPGASLNF